MNDTNYMKQALLQAQQALDGGEFPVGCVMVLDGHIIATGHRAGSCREQRNELDHGEMIALKSLIALGAEVKRDQVVVFSTLEPCLMCYSALIVNGIRKIVYAYEDVWGGGTNLVLSQLKPLYRAIPVEIVPGVLRSESLKLFKSFFSNPENDYLQGTPLAEHALSEPV